MNVRIRKSRIDDYDFLVQLETESFPVYQRSTNISIKRGIKSEFQEILILETNSKKKIKIGALVLFKYPRTLRIYSVAVLQEFKKMGYGDYLLKHVMELANRRQYEKVSIEVSANSDKLIGWYRERGFQIVSEIPDYYCKGEDALKMEYVTT